LKQEGPQSSTADTLAWVYYKQGRLSESGEVFLSILPGAGIDPIQRISDEEEYFHPVIWDHAGDALYRLGWTERAVRYWQKAIQGATKERQQTRETRSILQNTPGKIQAIKDKTTPAVAPLGQKLQTKTVPATADE
jgi:hypothetical protein